METSIWLDFPEYDRIRIVIRNDPRLFPEKDYGAVDGERFRYFSFSEGYRCVVMSALNSCPMRLAMSPETRWVMSDKRGTTCIEVLASPAAIDVIKALHMLTDGRVAPLRYPAERLSYREARLISQKGSVEEIRNALAARTLLLD